MSSPYGNITLSEIPDTIPALPAPPGQVTNFINPHTLGPNLIAEFAVLMPILLAVVFTRLYIRAKVVKSMGADDYTMIVAVLAIVAQCVIFLISIHKGLGRHLWDLRLVSLTPATLKLNSAMNPTYAIAAGAAKTSFALLYLRIFGGVSRKYRYLLWSYIAIVLSGYTALFIAGIIELVRCTNIFTYQSIAICDKVNYQVAATSSFNAFTDIILLILPIRQVLRLHLSTQKKIGLVAVFACGGIATIVSIVRLGLGIKYENNIDVYYTAVWLGQLTVVETYLGIIAANLSVLPKLREAPAFKSAQSYLSSIISKRKSSSRGSGSNFPSAVHHHKGSGSDSNSSVDARNSSNRFLARNGSSDIETASVPESEPKIPNDFITSTGRGHGPDRIKVETTTEVYAAMENIEGQHDDARKVVSPWLP